MTALRIRPALPSDRVWLRQAIVELQEAERRLHDSRLPGDAIADAYLASIEVRASLDAALLVAEIEGRFAGFVAGRIVEDPSVAETADSNRHAYVSDLFVAAPFRGRGVSDRLLEAIEGRLAETGVVRLRVGTLAANAPARRSYERAGFSPYELVYEKRLNRPHWSIREERPADFEAIRRLTSAAFAGLPDAEGDEADFVDRQRAGGGYVPGLALVASAGDAIAGHVMLTRFAFAGAAMQDGLLLLAIVSVATEMQRAGLGSRLTQEALARARSAGFKAAIVVGDPAFYRRFGFRAAAEFGIDNANGFPSANVMALEIEPGALEGASGSVRFPA